jgi:probable phosphoglycerate mutase
MRRVLVLRHGQSTWNVERRWQGWLDAPLTSTGEGQAMARGRALARERPAPVAVYTSDLTRARRTAELIAVELGVPSASDEGFRERHGGDWQGRTADEIDRRWPGLRDAWRRGEIDAPPGGETDQAVFERFDSALARMLDSAPPGDLVLVTHHGVLRIVATRAGVPVHALIPNLGGFWFRCVDGSLQEPDAIGPLVPDGDRPDVE